MLSGEGNARERWKITIGLISIKATLHVQHTFFVHFFAVVLRDYNVTHVLWRKFRTCSFIACVASVSVLFRSKERGTRVKDRAKNGTSKRAERGWGRKEGNACRQTPGFWNPSTWPAMPECAHLHLMLSTAVDFSYSDPRGTLENKLNDLIPLFSRKKGFAFKRRRVNLADQTKQQSQRACHVP